jgi:Zn-dependent peptidase ImmA (M78 family)
LTETDIDEIWQRVALSLDLSPEARIDLSGPIGDLTLKPNSNIAAQLAMRFRRHLRLGDVDPLFDLLEVLDRQLNVLVFPIDQDKLAGACAHIDHKGFIFIGNVAQEDLLLTCAHELAHLAMLSVAKGPQGGAILDAAFENGVSLKGPYELFAYNFALELLIPLRGLGIALQKIRQLLGIYTGALGDIELLHLSRIFGVSLRAIAIRCEKAKLLPKGGARSINQCLLQKFGNAEHRAEELGLPPRPSPEIPLLPLSLALTISKRMEDRTLGLERASIVSVQMTEGITRLRQ